MKIICTKQECELIKQAFYTICPFNKPCGYHKYGYRCFECIHENIDWEIQEDPAAEGGQE